MKRQDIEWRDKAAIPLSKALTLNCLSEGTAGTKMEKSLRERRSRDRPKLGSNSMRDPEA